MPTDRKNFAGVGVAVTFVAVLALIVSHDNAVTRADTSIIDAVTGARTPAIEWIASAVTLLGNFWVLLAATVLFGLVATWRAPQLREPFTPLAAFLLAAAVVPLLKLLIGRPRPPADVAALIETASGYPSGHSAQSMATWLGIALVLAAASPHPRRWIGAGLLITGLVGVSRVVLGVHSPTDVLGGWVLGVACVLLVRALAATWPAQLGRRHRRGHTPAGDTPTMES